MAGQVIAGRYRLKELIGVGGMDSAVWKAWQMGAERMVAIKVLPPADDASSKRFARGARIAANLSHPNCLVIHDYGTTEDGKLFLVMELLNGRVLHDVLSNEGMAVVDILHIGHQVLQALEHAHDERAVHRDLKPDNLFLCQKNSDAFHVKILDFGIAKYIEEEYDEIPLGDGKKPSDGFEDLVTEQRQVCGTPQYMAPEQVVGARVDGRADLYALGCVLYKMLTGRLPFEGKTRYELYQKHLQEPPQAFSAVRPDLRFPDRLELIVMKALAKRPQQRFQTAAEMREALASVVVTPAGLDAQPTTRTALKDTSETSGFPATVVHDANPADMLGAVLSQTPLKPSFMAARAPIVEVEIDDEPTRVRGIPAFELDDDAPSTLAPAFANPIQAERPSTAHYQAAPNPPAKPQPKPPIDPTIIPHGVWTLSRPAPSAAAIAKAAAPVLAMPSASHPSLTRVTPPTAARVPTPGPVVAAPAAARAPMPTGAFAGTPAMPSPSPWMTNPAHPSLADPILRHPSSRPSLTTSTQYPRSPETEPSSVSGLHDPERPRWMVAAMLGGAFLLGVGGVSLALSLAGNQGGPEIAGAAVSVQKDAPFAAAPTTTNAGIGVPAEPLAGETAETPETIEIEPGGEAAELVPAPEEDVAPALPETAKVSITSIPPGAEVFDGETRLGETPLVTELGAGDHRLELKLRGYDDSELTVTATPSLDETAPAEHEVTLVRLAVRPVVRAPTPTYVAPVPRPPTPREPVETPRPVPEVKPVEIKQPPAVVTPPKPREVKLLEDLDAPVVKPKPVPKVDLLDEGEPAAKPKPKPKAQIQTLDEL